MLRRNSAFLFVEKTLFVTNNKQLYIVLQYLTELIFSININEMNAVKNNNH